MNDDCNAVGNDRDEYGSSGGCVCVTVGEGGKGIQLHDRSTYDNI